MKHILILADREWTHPQAGGTGTVLYGMTARWLAQGHRVTIIAGSYPGAASLERPTDRLEIHRTGGRLTVFAGAALKTLRGVGRDADVVLEVCNGIAFYTPLWPWLRKPRVLLIFHVHQRHYVAELGTLGSISAFFLERLPLTTLYRSAPVMTISEDSRAELIELGLAAQQIKVIYLGLDRGILAPGPKSADPTMIYLGRLKQYKRIEVLLAMMLHFPEVTLHLAGDGIHRGALEVEAERLGISHRVEFHGHVTEETKAELLRSSWLALTASSAEGWSLAVFEAGASGTPTAALAVGGLREAILPGETGLLADSPAELALAVRALLDDPELLAELGEAAYRRSLEFTWDATAEAAMTLLDSAIDQHSRR
jgi:glycosyltransferase involved in cell wall biosynthesis